MGANLAIPQVGVRDRAVFSTGLDRRARPFSPGRRRDDPAVALRRARDLVRARRPGAPPAAGVPHDFPLCHAPCFRFRALPRGGPRGRRRPRSGYLVSRFLANILKAAGFLLLALFSLLVLRTGDTKRSLVRAWRSCGYLYQILRSALDRI